MTICRNLDKFLGFTEQQRATITELNLYNNHIGDEGSIALAAALKDNSLTKLNLSRNNIGAEGATALAAALQDNNSLTSLDLAYNQISDEGASALARALQGSIALTSLCLLNTNVNDEVRQSIRTLIFRNKEIIHREASNALIKISEVENVVDIDLNKIVGVSIEGIINPIINPLDAYLQNPSIFNAESNGLASCTRLESLVNRYKSWPLEQVIKAKIDQGEHRVGEMFHVPLPLIGKFMDNKDAENLKLAFEGPNRIPSTESQSKGEQDEEEGGGGGRSFLEAIAAEAEAEEAAAELLAATFGTPQNVEEDPDVSGGNSGAAEDFS
jgi:hypothetical protein